jgi:hypothetical protein
VKIRLLVIDLCDIDVVVVLNVKSSDLDAVLKLLG